MTGFPAARVRVLAADVLLGLLCCLAGSAWLVVVEPSRHGTGGSQVAGIAGLAMTQTVLISVVLLGLLRADPRPSSPVRELLWLAPAQAFAIAAGAQLHAVSAGHVGGSTTLLGDASTALVALVPLVALFQAARRVHAPGVGQARRLGAVTVGFSMVAAVVALTPVGTATAATPGCLDGGPADTSFDVTALDVDIPIDRFGDHDPHGVMYALTDRIGAIRDEEASQQVSIGLRDDPIQPLVIRANEGDCVAVTFTNDTARGPLGMHIDGLEFAVSSSGDQVGQNASSAAAQGATISYRYLVPDDPRAEGGHYVHPGAGHRADINHGLFGSLVVEPPGSTYWDATDPGTPLASGWEAIIKPAGTDVPCVVDSPQQTCAFREAALLHHEIGNDNEQITAKDGEPVPLVDNITGSYRPGAFAMNYRSESFRNRLLDFPKAKSHAYSSYTFGEPSTPMMRGYLADPTKIRLMHTGTEKFHIFHLHGGGDRWRFNPVSDTSFNYADTGLRKDPTAWMTPSQRLDSQSIGPGESYNLEIEGGAGGVQQSVGDFLLHCHIAKHYVSGMWALWRVFDTLQPDLVPLGDRTPPPSAVTSAGLIGHSYGGTKITAKNLDSWIRPQLPPSGVPANDQDATVMDWKVAGTSTQPLYLGAPADPTNYTESPKILAGQPNLLLVDQGRVVGGRPAILFNPLNGRPAYPLLRPHIGGRPPFTGDGHTGAPYLGNNADAPASGPGVDPYAHRVDGLCPAGRTLRTYNVVAVAKPIRRTPTFVDPDGKVFVLAKNKAALLASPDGGEPLAIRANQGDCVALTLNSEIPDDKAFDGFSKVSMHIHHMQFDIQGSDGVSAGFAYEHSVRPYNVVEATLIQNAIKGANFIKLSSVAGLTGTDANGKVAMKWIAIGQGTENIEIKQIKSVSTGTRTVTLTAGLNKAHSSGEFAGTEFEQSRWYPDTLLDNVFWHDHVDGIHGWGHGLVGQIIIEPKGSTWTDPVTGQPADSGTLVDIHTSNALAPGLVDGSFRELALWTINDNDRDAFSTLNLRANPLADRPDKAHQFSSWTYGDPLTPLPRLYPNDPLVVRTISISPSLETLHFLGANTLLEPRQTANGAPTGTFIDAIHSGISERFTLVLNGQPDGMRLRPGDYLYANGMETKVQQGAWGIVRVLPGQIVGLKPLPGVSTPSTPYTEPSMTGGAPPAAAGPGNPCPAGAPARSFDLTAIDRSGTFNGARTAYVPTVDAAAIKQRLKLPEPLVMHVVTGECVTVTLRNQLLTPVGFAMGKLAREAGSGGVDVGFDPEQNVDPGGSRVYKYYVPTDHIGSAAIGDLANATSMKSGLYGAVVVAPASTVSGQPTIFRDPATGALKDLGPQVLVRAPGQSVPNYRDDTVFVADDDIAIGRDQMPYPTNANAGRSLLTYNAAPAGESFTDPGGVPTLTGYAGDPTVVHVVGAPGSENSHVFSLGGLRWPQDRTIANSNWNSAQGMGAWETFDLNVVGGAGGGRPGDYLYGDLRRPFQQAGVWGLQRALPADSCTVRRVDASPC